VTLGAFGRLRGRVARQRWDVAVPLGLTMLGLGLRILYVWQANGSSPDGPERLSADEPGYDNLARALLNGEGFVWPGRVPLYPLWVAVLHWATGFSYDRIFYVQVVPATLTVVLTWLLAWRTFGPSAAAVAGLGAAVHFVLVRQPAQLLSEVLFTPAVLLVALALQTALARRTLAWFALTGVAIGVANLVRPTLVAFPLALAIALVLVVPRRLWVRAGTTLVLAALLVVLPWVVRNYARYQAVYPLATSNAILWQGSPEYFHLVKREGYTYLQVWNEVIYGPGGEGHDPGTVEGDRYWTRRALRSIAAEPLVYIRFCAEKAFTYWIGDPNADWDDTYVFNFRALRAWGFTRFETAQLVAARALPLVAFAAALYLRRSWRALFPVHALLVYCTALHALTHAEARLSEPLHPMLLVVLGGAAARLLARGRRDAVSSAHGHLTS
jgi:4-amino-4-deoxy-L-arabinose transferase-like glycosyltransferase